MSEDYNENLRTEYVRGEDAYEDTADEHSGAWLDDHLRLKEQFPHDYIERCSYLHRIKEELRRFFPNGIYKSESQIDYKVFSDNYEVMKTLKTATGLLQDAAVTCSGLSDNDPAKKAKTAAVEALSVYIGYHCALKLAWEKKTDANEKFYDVWPVVFFEVLKQLKNYIGDDNGEKSFRQYIYRLTNWRYSNIKNQLKEYSKEYPKVVGNDDDENNLFLQMADDVSRIENTIRRIQEVEEALEFCLISKDPIYKITQEEYDIITYFLGLCEGIPEALSRKEIAKKINRSYPHVNKHFHCAADKLRKLISKKYYS